jgi:hypothetical protein
MIEAVKPTAKMTATLVDGTLTLTLTDANDGALALSALTNPKISLVTGTGKQQTKLLDGATLNNLTVSGLSSAASGTEYTGTVTSDNYQTITFKVTARTNS